MSIINKVILFFLLVCKDVLASDEYTHLRKSEPAPFDGTLLSPEALATVITTYDTDLSICKIEADKIKEKLDVKYTIREDKCKFDYTNLQKLDLKLLATKQEEIEALRGLIKKQNKNLIPFFIGLSFIAGSATTVGTFYLYEEIETRIK